MASGAAAMLLPGTTVLVDAEPTPRLPRAPRPRERIDADVVVNAAGLYADEVSRAGRRRALHDLSVPRRIRRAGPRARSLVRGLVYPVPHASGHGLGVHLDADDRRRVWLGPTIRYQDGKTDYENDRLPLEAFLEPTRRLLPQVTLDDLRLGRQRHSRQAPSAEERFADFLIRRDADPALIHAAGIDSPGLTACLAIGERRSSGGWLAVSS